MRNKFIPLIPLLLFFSCSYFQGEKFSYKTYTHPSLQFSIEYPKKWTSQEGGNMGTQVVFYSNKASGVFHANANIVVTRADITNLDELMKLSGKQLKLILNQYEVITQNSTKLGNLDGFEIRGKYTAKEGTRVIRTIVALNKNTEYVFTFTCSQDEEKNYTQIINYMIQSFHV